LLYAELVLAYVQREKIMGGADDAKHQLRILRLAQKGKSSEWGLERPRAQRRGVKSA